jgi:hypothetical protein
VPPRYIKTVRFLPGILAPKNQESASDKSVPTASSLTWSVQASSASGGSRHAGQTLLAQIADAIGNPLDILLDASGHVAERGSIVGTDKCKQIRKASALNAKVCQRPIGPFVFQRESAFTADVNPGQGTSHSVETGRIDDHVEFVLRSGGLDPHWRDPLDWRLADVDQQDIVPIELLVVAALQGNPFGSERMVFGNQLFRYGWVLDAFSNLVANELREQLIGLLFGQDVVEIAEPFGKTWLLPQFLELCLAFLRSHLENRPRIEVVDKAGEGFARSLEDCRIVGFDLGLSFGIYRPVA